MATSTYIIIKTNFKATHNWPEATQFAGADVKFLESEHRHTFYVNVKYQVVHDDRDVEFFVFQHQVNNIIATLYPNYNKPVAELGRRSCEQIAKEIIQQLRLFGYKAPVVCEVWEDNEVGAQVQDEI